MQMNEFPDALYNALRQSNVTEEVARATVKSYVVREQALVEQCVQASRDAVGLGKAEWQTEFAKLRGDVAVLASKVTTLEAKMDSKFMAMEAKMDGKFTAMDGKFAVIDAKFGSVASEMLSLEARLNANLEKQFNRALFVVGGIAATAVAVTKTLQLL